MNFNWKKYVFIPLIGLVIYLALLVLLVQFETQIDGSNIQTIGDAVWYSLVTLTTVGYGDFYPVSFPGQLIGGVFVLASLGLLGFLIGKIGDKISEYREYRLLGHHGTDFTNHIILIGWNDFSRLILEELVLSDLKVAIVTESRDNIDLIYDEYDQKNVFVLYADHQNYEVLSKANIDEARKIFINLGEDTENFVTFLNLNKEFENSNFLTVIENEEMKETFRIQKDLEVVSRHELSSQLIASRIFEADVAEYGNDLIRSKGDGDTECEIRQYRVNAGHDFAGETFGEVSDRLFSRFNIPLLAISTRSQVDPEIYLLPEDDLSINSGDYLIVIDTNKSDESLEEFMGASDGLLLSESLEQDSRIPLSGGNQS